MLDPPYLAEVCLPPGVEITVRMVNTAVIMVAVSVTINGECG
jgi:hypothetical protein